MRLDEARKITLVAIQEKMPLMLWGPPGIGKSAMVIQVAEELKLNLEDVRLAQLEPTDLRGFLAPNRETHKAEWFHLEMLPESNAKGMGKKGPGILFLDEIDKAPVSVKNAALQLVLDRKVGNYTLPKDWEIISAGNREEDGAFSVPLGSALTNRLIHVEVEQDADIWVKWAFKNEVEETIIGYIVSQPQNLYENTGQHAFPSPRSWTMASKLFKHAEGEEEQKRLVASAIGEGHSVQFMAWQKIYSKINPMEILEKGKMPEFKSNEQSLKYAVTMAIAFIVRKQDANKYMENIGKFMNTIPADMKIVFLKQLPQTTLVEFTKFKGFDKIVKDLIELTTF